MAVQMLGIKTKFTDDQGRPLVGGKVHAYFAGTTTYQDTFKDPDMTIVNTNPIILDDSGSADVYLNGSYRIRIFDKNDVLIEEQDGVTQSASGEITTAKGEIIGLYGAVLNSLTNEVKRAVAAEKTIADSLTSETTRAKAAESALQSSIDAEATRAKAAESDLNDSIIKEVSDRELEVTRLDEADAVLQAQINSVGGGKLAYKTYAEMIADKSNIDAKSSIDIIADTDDKNGMYLYDGTNFVKSQYDLEKLIRAKVQNTFRTHAQMVASNLSDGSYALVADDTDDKNGIYIKEGGAWVKSEYDPVAQAKIYTDIETEVIKDIGNTDKYAFAISDTGGNVAVGVDADGSANFASIKTEVLESEKFLIADSVFLKAEDAAWSVSDEAGAMPIAVTREGIFKVAEIDAKEIKLNGKDIRELSSTYKKIGNYPANLVHFEVYGQSLSQGAYSLPIQTTTQKYDSLMFTGGIRPQHPHDTSVSFYEDFIPLVEAESGDGYVGYETPVSGAAEAIKQLIKDENSIAFDEQQYQLLGTACGEGGVGIASLTTTYFENNLKPAITNAFNLAQAKGMTYAMPLMGWVQGEEDNKSNRLTLVADYQADMQTLINKVDTHLKTLNPALQMDGLIAGQLCSFKTSGRSEPRVELAIYEASIKTDNNVYLACPFYIFDYKDGFHVDGVSSKWMGAYIGLVHKRVVVDKERWLPVHPVSHVKQGRILEVKFHVPVQPLVFDVNHVALNANYGFTLVDANNNSIAINSVTLTQGDAVKFTTDTAIPDGAKLRYAWTPIASPNRNTGPRGNLRDSQGNDIVFDPQGINKPMHNWAPIFEYGV